MKMSNHNEWQRLCILNGKIETVCELYYAVSDMAKRMKIMTK